MSISGIESVRSTVGSYSAMICAMTSASDSDVIDDAACTNQSLSSSEMLVTSGTDPGDGMYLKMSCGDIAELVPYSSSSLSLESLSESNWRRRLRRVVPPRGFAGRPRARGDGGVRDLLESRGDSGAIGDTWLDEQRIWMRPDVLDGDLPAVPWSWRGAFPPVCGAAGESWLKRTE